MDPFKALGIRIMTKSFPDADLSTWADCLIDYAEDWDTHFGKFFTQEFGTCWFRSLWDTGTKFL